MQNVVGSLCVNEESTASENPSKPAATFSNNVQHQVADFTDPMISLVKFGLEPENRFCFSSKFPSRLEVTELCWRTELSWKWRSSAGSDGGSTCCSTAAEGRRLSVSMKRFVGCGLSRRPSSQHVAACCSVVQAWPKPFSLPNLSICCSMLFSDTEIQTKNDSNLTFNETF